MFYFVTFTKLLAGALSLTSAYVLPSHAAGNDHALAIRENTWAEFDQNSESFVKQGLCRTYPGPTEHKKESVEYCLKYCNSKSASCVLTGTSFEELDQRKALFIDPANKKYAVGECVCGADPIAEAIFNFTAEALGEAEPIICEVWLDSLSNGATILSTLTLPGSISLKAFKAVSGLVSKADKIGKVAGLGGISDLVTKTCGSDRIYGYGLTNEMIDDATEKIKQIDLSQLTEAVMP